MDGRVLLWGMCRHASKWWVEWSVRVRGSFHAQAHPPLPSHSPLSLIPRSPHSHDSPRSPHSPLPRPAPSMLRRTLPCPHIPLADLIRATNGWAEGRRVGGGRWSDVYRGEWGESGESGRRAEGGKSEERSEAESDGGNGRGGEGKQDGGEGKQDGGEGKQEGGEEGGALQRKQGMRAGRGRARGRGGVWAVKRMRGGPPWESLEAHALALARVGHPNVLRLVGWCSWQAGGGIEGLPEAGQRGVQEGGGEGGMQEGRARGEERGGQERGAKGGGKERGEEGSRQEEGEEKGGQEGGEEGQVLVYEWMERGSLQAVLQAAAQAGSSPLSLRQRVGITVGVLRALKAVQSHGQVHGDLKPSNVLLTVAWEARVGDWSAVRMGQRVHVDMGGHQEDMFRWDPHVQVGPTCSGVQCGSAAATAAYFISPTSPFRPPSAPFPPPLRASLLQGERTGERLDSREGDSGERREGGGQSIGRWSGLFWGSGTGIWDGQGSGGALGTRLAMLGSEDSREFVV
ncbi:unnamed protein product [Closterium sp. NIES-65]|nr:unnamed protein product [Closterium sp. NIES-65]